MSSLSAWTCGKCGERFESDGVVGDLRVMRWRREHLEEHRVTEMTPEERRVHRAMEAESLAAGIEIRRAIEARG